MSVPCDKVEIDRRPRFTWEHFEALDYLATSGLHGDPVIADQEGKHDEGDKLAGVGLQGAVTSKTKIKWRQLIYFVAGRKQPYDN